MSMALVALLVLSSLPLPSDIAPAASAQEDEVGNLLLNPGFERSFDDPGTGPKPIYWQVSPYPLPENVSTHQDPAWRHNGSHSLVVSQTQRAYTGPPVTWHQESEAVTGELLYWGGWARNGGMGQGVEARLRLLAEDALGETVGTWSASIDGTSQGWVELRGEPVVLGPDVTRVRMECVLSGVGTAWFDDVYVGRPTDMDNPPFIVSVPPVEAAVGHEYSYRPRAVDLEGDPVSYELYRGPEGMVVTPEGCLTWTPDRLPDGAVKVVLRAVDDSGTVSYQDFFLQVREEPLERPVHVLLYSTYDDPFNDNVSGERYLRLLPVVQDLRDGHADLRPSVTVLMSGAEAGGGNGSRAEAVSEISRLANMGLVEPGYSSFHEPTFSTNPLYDPGYGSWTWSERVTAVSGYLTRARDPVTGQTGHGTGGLRSVSRQVGNVSALAGYGQDGAQLHALSRYDNGSVVLGIEGGPSGPGILGANDHEGTLVAMLSEDPGTPGGLYWKGGRLVAALDGTGVGTHAARRGPGDLKDALPALDRRSVNVVPVLVADTATYCNGSTVVDGDLVLAPTDWAWSHPDSPWLPAGAVRPSEERHAMYDATCATLEWLAGEMLPSTGGRFLSGPALAGMVDPGSDVQVSAAELAASADDLVGRRSGLRYPGWVGVSWGFCRGDYQYFSLADMYCLLSRALSSFDGEGQLPGSVDLAPAYGPRGEALPPSQPWNRLTLAQVVDEASDQATRFDDDAWRVEPRGVVPSSVSPGGVEMNAMEFLLLMAETYLLLYEGAQVPNPLISVYPTLQWPLTRRVLAMEGKVTDSGDSWTLKPASSDLQQDLEPPAVRYVSPAHGSVSVPLGTNITVTFSERMDETLDLYGAVVLHPPAPVDVRWDYHRLVVDPLGDLLDNATYTVTLKRRFTDLAGNPLASEVTWDFSTVGLANAPPTLFPWPSDPAVEVEENQTVRLGVLAEDDGPPPLSYRWLVDGISVTGEVGDNLEFVTSFTDSGEHTVTVVVSDSAGPPGTSSFTWNLTVANVNLPPVLLGRVPEDDPVEVTEVDGSVGFAVRASDPDEGVLRHGWNLSGRPVPEGDLAEEGAVFTMPLTHESSGTHQVTCLVHDRAGEGFTVNWTLVVLDVNRPPVIVGVEPSIPPTVDIGETVTVEVNATDPDGDALSYNWSVNGVPAGVTEEGEWPFEPGEDGTFEIVVAVSDGRGGTVLGSAFVNVLPEPPPQPPMRASPVWPWLLVLVVAAAIALAVMWPRWRRRP